MLKHFICADVESCRTYYDVAEVLLQIMATAIIVAVCTTVSANLLTVKNYSAAVRSLKITAIISVIFLGINFWVTPDSTTTRVMKMILGSNGYLGLADYTTVGGNPMTHRLHVNESDATKDPVRFEGVRLESGSSNDLVTIDASGVLKRRSFSVGSSAVFTAPSAASTGTQTVTFGSPKANTNYNTQCTVTGLLGYCAITNKTVNGFTITWYAQASGSGSADWQASGGN